MQLSLLRFCHWVEDVVDHWRRKNLLVSLRPVLSVAWTPVYAMTSFICRSEPLVTRTEKVVVVPATSLSGRPFTSAVRPGSTSQSSPFSSASLVAFASAASAATFTARASSTALSSTPWVRIAAPRASATFFWASAAVTSVAALAVAAAASAFGERGCGGAPLLLRGVLGQCVERGLRVGHGLVGVLLCGGGVLGRTLGGGQRHSEGVGAIELAELLGQLDCAIRFCLGGLVVRLLRLGGGRLQLVDVAGLLCLPGVCAVALASA
ncbi:hypothetical protein ACWF76_14895 [Streptomyces globisporus]